MPVDRKANDSVGYFGKMPYSGYFGSPFSVGWVGYFGRNLPRQITKFPRRSIVYLDGLEKRLRCSFKRGHSIQSRPAVAPWPMAIVPRLFTILTSDFGGVLFFDKPKSQSALHLKVLQILMIESDAGEV